ncbi:MAG: hypothetical protein DRO12_01820 [Thermoprotei archaeon]|nr:MAG: hypothetical protein DRO12_01820 [Thermoprotei archaeon]
MEILELTKDSFPGVFALHHLCEDLQMGGIGRPRKQFFRTRLEKLKPIESYLLVSITANDIDKNAKWKLSLNGVTVTRELKPQLELTDSEFVHALYIYDVTHALLKNPAEPDVMLIYDSRKPITIDAVSLLVFYKVENSESIVKGFVGLQILKEGQEVVRGYSLAKDLKGNFNNYYIGMATNASIANVRLQLDNNQHHLRMLRGFNDYELKLKNPITRSTLAIESTTPRRSTVKLIYDIMSMSNIAMPQLRCSVKIDDNHVKVFIRNDGAVPPDDAVQVLLMRAGAVVDRTVVPPIKPGSEISVSLNMRKNYKEMGGITLVRILWRRAARVFTEDIRLITS